MSWKPGRPEGSDLLLQYKVNPSGWVVLPCRLWVVAPPWPDHSFSNGWRSLLRSPCQDQIKRCTQDGWARSKWKIGGQDEIFPVFPPFPSFLLLPSVRWMMCERNIICSVFTVDFVLSSSVLLSQFRWQWREMQPKNWPKKYCSLSTNHLMVLGPQTFIHTMKPLDLLRSCREPICTEFIGFKQNRGINLIFYKYSE